MSCRCGGLLRALFAVALAAAPGCCQSCFIADLNASLGLGRAANYGPPVLPRVDGDHSGYDNSGPRVDSAILPVPTQLVADAEIVPPIAPEPYPGSPPGTLEDALDELAPPAPETSALEGPIIRQPAGWDVRAILLDGWRPRRERTAR